MKHLPQRMLDGSVVLLDWEIQKRKYVLATPGTRALEVPEYLKEEA